MNKYIAILSTAGIILITACSKKKDTKVVPDPVKATLTFPDKNSACTTGTQISDTQSSITFTWNSSANTDSYELNIKNLITGVTSTQTTTANHLPINLLRNTPYSWFVISKSTNSTATAQSDTWKFYNAGAGTSSHPPFPADNLSPSFGQAISATTGTINLTWTSSDPDNDIATYDVYFGTSSNPGAYKSSITNKFSNGVVVKSGTTYYWKVITKDSQGNTSDSGTYHFTVN
ncbi:hypothetical protein PQ469_29690 [Mucilaginibacter sp. KACC 22773]|uniref:hypothetical protein n=1 Tax=Mucilaginibacter sp. KACC 22773 TaxID=3025671 RepID=UPI002365B485|nr:hypothetical protein [Mucilaginibacter sp. KACC 22773]WDF78059.1 hypothetical protein PQ469_29690 [Mucilaginibacter sp. KACC 22773]